MEPNGSRRGWLLAVALIAAPLLLVAGSWNEITAGPAEADLAPPSDVAPAQDETDPVADNAGSDEDAEPGTPIDPDTGEPVGAAGGEDPGTGTDAEGP